MEARKHLIVIKGKDQTDSVASFRFRDGKCEVIYSCAPDKAYIFQRGNVEILPLQKKINPAQVIVTVNGRNIGEIDELLDFGAYFRIVRSHPAGSASSTSSEGLPEHRHHYAIPRSGGGHPKTAWRCLSRNRQQQEFLLRTNRKTQRLATAASHCPLPVIENRK